MKPSEELSAVCFDEINTSDQRDLDIKYDTFIPLSKEANIFFVRTLTNADLKMPAYILNDGVYDKIQFNDIIYLLKKLGLKILAMIFFSIFIIFTSLCFALFGNGRHC